MQVQGFDYYCGSVHKLIDGLVQGGQLVGIVGGGIGNAVLQMVFQDNFRRAVEGGAHRSQLHQDLGTIPAVLHHALDRLQVADGPGQAVQHRLGLGMAVAVAVVMGVVMFMVVVMIVGMGVKHAVTMVMVIEFVLGMFHCRPPKDGLNPIYTLP